MTDKKIYDKPSNVTAEDGAVIVQGPDAVDVSMTPEAADETSRRLLFGAMQALGDKIPVADLQEKKSKRPEASE
jgi:hypothetical protein